MAVGALLSRERWWRPDSRMENEGGTDHFLKSPARMMRSFFGSMCFLERRIDVVDAQVLISLFFFRRMGECLSQIQVGHNLTGQRRLPCSRLCVSMEAP